MDNHYRINGDNLFEIVCGVADTIEILRVQAINTFYRCRRKTQMAKLMLYRVQNLVHTSVYLVLVLSVHLIF